MIRCWRKPAGRISVLVAVLLLGSASIRAELKSPARLAGATESAQKAWLDGLALLDSGQFNEAGKRIHEVATQPDADPRARQIEKWVSGFEQLQTDRTQRIQQDYGKYVQSVKEETDKKNWRKAIWYCGMAFNYAADQDAFRKEPWLLKTADGAAGAARDFEKDGKWLKAATIYVRLTEIFPYNKEYREALDRCQAHIRLEFTYTPESDWKASVNDITPDMAREAFRKIDAEYLKEPSFKEATVAGLKQVLRLAREPKLEKVFPALADKDAVSEFCSRVEAKLAQAEDAQSLKAKSLNEIFDRVLAINDEIKLVPQNVLIYEFVQGALQPLDRFSDMIWPADLQEFNKHTQGRFSGVGIQIRKGPGEPIRVISPLEDTPAYRAGIQPNDMITKINGKPTKKYNINQAVREITGPAGTTVNLTFKRPGLDKEFDVDLERQEITIFTIKGFDRDAKGDWKYMIDPDQKIAYVRMTNFTDQTTDELKTVLGELQKDGLRGLIFDLRGNPGGPLKTAVEVSDLFLDGEKPIVSTKDRHGKDWSMASSTGEEHFVNFPMIILANRTSASASEIVTGALQVHHRALIVGERTFGKGSVQQVLRLNSANPAYLKLTTAHYYLPDGRCLHRDEDSLTWGVDPDAEVKLVPKEIIKANELRLQTDILKGVNQKELSREEIKSLTEYKPTSRPTSAEADEDAAKSPDEEIDEEMDNIAEDPNTFPARDPQLEASVMLMRVRLESDQPWPDRTAKVAVRGNGAASGS